MTQQWEAVVTEFSSPAEVLHQWADTAFQCVEAQVAQQDWFLVRDVTAEQNQP